MKKILSRFLLFNMHFTEAEQKIRHQFIFLNNVFFFAGVMAFFLGFYRIQYSITLGIFDFVFAFLDFSLLYYLRHHKEKVKGLSTIALLMAFTLFYAIFLLSPYNTQRLCLFFLLSASTFFLKGRRVGLIWTGIIIISIIVGAFLPGVSVYYSTFDIVFVCINLIGLFFIFDNYELIKEEQTEHLESLNRRLAKTVKKRNRELRLSNKTLKSSEQRFKQAFDDAAIGMALVSLEGQWLKVNQSLCQLIGYTEKELLQIDFQTITYPDDLQTDLEYVNELLQGKIRTYQMEKRYICKNGKVVWILLNVSLLKDKAIPLYFIAQIQNIDTQKKAEEKLKEMAYHDVLTGLANRKQLEQSFRLQVAYALRHDSKIAVLFIDLDGFKKINDNFGHDAGDLLLIEVAARLKSCVRSTDMAGRQGGDEFIIILSEIDTREDILLVIKQIFKTITRPIQIKQNLITITPSIGISIYPENGLEWETLIKQADAALYTVKSSGKDNYRFHEVF